MFSDDSTPIPAQDTVSYTILLDSVNPPSTKYAVPPAAVAAAIEGLVSVPFADIGFTPVHGVTYFAEITATDNGLTSGVSNLDSFLYASLVPKPPTGFTHA